MPAEGERFATLIQKGFDIVFVSHAKAILEQEFPDQLENLETVLKDLSLPITEIIGSGGGETKFTQRLRHTLSGLGWHKHKFEVQKTIDGQLRESISHEVDHVKRVEGVGTIALEIEWNNKDPFFDRDLENFKRLHAEGAISVGVLITRGKSLQDSMKELVTHFVDQKAIASFDDFEGFGYVPTPKQKKNVLARVNRTKAPLSFREAWTSNFVANKFGQATTHWTKLMDRVDRGVGNPCPLLLIGLPASMVTFDQDQIEMVTEEDLNDSED